MNRKKTVAAVAKLIGLVHSLSRLTLQQVIRSRDSSLRWDEIEKLSERVLWSRNQQDTVAASSP